MTALSVAGLSARIAYGNDLEQYYNLAVTRDTTLAAAQFQRDALIEARPQAIAQWLPQVAANASAVRERLGFGGAAAQGSEAADCAISSSAESQHCYGTAHTLGVTVSQTLWSFQSFSQLKEANFQVAAAEAAFRGAQESLLLRVAVAYFGILSAADQLATNRGEREAFGSLLSQARTRQETGVGPRSDVDQAQAFYDATEESVIDAQNALDDANLALGEIVGEPVSAVAPLREDIPLTAPDPQSLDEWVLSARQDNFDVRAAGLKMQAASRDISVQRGRALPTVSLTGSGSKITESAVLGGDQALDTVGVSFTWPLFQGGTVSSAIRQSRALYRESQAVFDTAQRDAERQARAAFRGIVTGIQRIAAARRAVESGATAVEAMRRNVEFGTGTEFELLDAQNNYYAARRSYSQARYDYLTNVLTLKQQTGRLTERDLLAIDAFLIDNTA